MDYRETVEYMYSQLPMYHRIGKAAYKNNMNNANVLDSLCGYPHRKYLTIHVAGTNGKGSVSHMLASVLHAAGYKTGLFTSPHLEDFRERIRINGTMISENAVTDFIRKIKNELEELKPSFFEITSAMAFDYFSKEVVDVAVIETGLGGRLDSTNIIIPELSIITNIGFDHTEILGDTLVKIAAEKAGIIKPGIPVVVGESHPETKQVFTTFANQNGSPIIFADQIYHSSILENTNLNIRIAVKKKGEEGSNIYNLDLPGIYQQRNICTVLTALDILNKRKFIITHENIEKGLRNASGNTGLKGRWQVLSQKPLVICDTGHNPDGIRWVVNQISQQSFDKLHFIFGVVNDKDLSHILPLLPKDAEFYFTRADIPRAMEENELMQKAKTEGLKGKAYLSVSLALETAIKNASANDLIFIGGSTFIVADALRWKGFF